ncbi:MDR family MFS transporter [Nocardioides sp. R-C-SC26]|uniref:MDR family MFS transporter n=1 Tax=Nocardioides sp. R-C-SC26 TaxID=2870414 RepID=UPI001E61F5F7|nr:MDR family MFS transporter [Nocardioides sp. R-C-SC26]
MTTSTGAGPIQPERAAGAETPATPDTPVPAAVAPSGGASSGGASSGGGGPVGDFTHAQVLTILSGLLLGMFLAALDQTIVSTSIRTIADDLQGLSQQAWVTTAYLITGTITTPIFGKLGDIYGRKRLFMFAITIFVAGSALCSFATSMTSLAAFRAIQGLGAGGLIPLVLAIIGDIVSPRERAKYTGYFMATFGASSVLGPLVGGFLAGRDEIAGIAGWRWVFLVNVPVGLVAFVVVSRTLRLPATRRRGVRIDWWGAAFLAITLVPLLTVAEQGRSWGWLSGRSATAYAIGALGLLGFVLIERRLGDAALIPPRLFRIRAAAVTIAASMAVGVAMFGGIMLLPLYLQIVHGASPTESGLLMLPMVVGMMLASITSGRMIARTGHVRMFPIVGSAMATVALLLLSLVSADTDLRVVMVPMFLLGLGLGQCMQPLLLTVQSAVPPSEIGMATSSATFFRQIGGTIGVAALLSVLFGTLGGNITTAFSDAAAKDPDVAAAMASPEVERALDTVADDSSVIERLDPEIAHPIKVGFSESMDRVFLIAAGAGLVAFLILLLMPAVRLRDTSAMAAARAAVPAEEREG